MASVHIAVLLNNADVFGGVSCVRDIKVTLTSPSSTMLTSSISSVLEIFAVTFNNGPATQKYLAFRVHKHTEGGSDKREAGSSLVFPLTNPGDVLRGFDEGWERCSLDLYLAASPLQPSDISHRLHEESEWSDSDETFLLTYHGDTGCNLPPIFQPYNLNGVRVYSGIGVLSSSTKKCDWRITATNCTNDDHAPVVKQCTTQPIPLFKREYDHVLNAELIQILSTNFAQEESKFHLPVDPEHVAFPFQVLHLLSQHEIQALVEQAKHALAHENQPFFTSAWRNLYFNQRIMSAPTFSAPLQRLPLAFHNIAVMLLDSLGFVCTAFREMVWGRITPFFEFRYLSVADHNADIDEVTHLCFGMFFPQQPNPKWQKHDSNMTLQDFFKGLVARAATGSEQRLFETSDNDSWPAVVHMVPGQVTFPSTRIPYM